MIANMQIKGVIFDLMDTLAYIDSEIYLSTHHQFAEIMGVSWERFNDTWKMSRPKALTGFFSTTEQRFDWITRKLNLELSHKVFQEIVQAEKALWQNNIKLFTDASPLLYKLRQNRKKTALVSNGTPAMTGLTESLAIDSLIDIFILSCKVGHKKPDQIIYKKALEALELSPLECVFVGDGNDFELDGAKSIGMHTIRITRPLGPYASSSNQSTAFDFQVASLSELHQLLLDQ